MRKVVRDRGLRYKRAAIILVVIATVFWLWFGIGSAIVTKGTAFDWFMHLMMPGGIFILSALIAWKWNRVGGIILILEGFLALVFVIIAFVSGNYESTTFILMMITLCFPPLVSGIFFIFHGLQIRRAALKEDFN